MEANQAKNILYLSLSANKNRQVKESFEWSKVPYNKDGADQG
jgi:hypothetical protein